MKLITTIVFNCDILPYFIEHYKGLGFNEILCILNVNGNKDIASQVEEKSKNTIFKVVKTIDELYHTSFDAWNMEEIKNKFIGHDEWFSVADLDEFHEYELPIDQVIKTAEEENSNCVVGRFLDRISADGSFPPLDMSKSLNEQFPLGCKITKNILKGNDRKVMLLRGNKTAITKGFHLTFREKTCSIKKNIVHHFKWSRSVIEGARYKSEAYCRRSLASAFDYLKHKSNRYYMDRADVDSLRAYKETMAIITTGIDITNPLLKLRTIYKGK